MKHSIGYTVSLNIVIVFIVIVFAFIFGILSYYKSYKINNIIVEILEKNEYYGEDAKKEISQKLSSLGYDQSKVNCGTTKVETQDNSSATKHQMPALNADDADGYCVYLTIKKRMTHATTKWYNDTWIEPLDKIENDSGRKYGWPEEYAYIVKTYMPFNIPIINHIIKIPVYAKTKTMYACYGANC